MYTRISSRWNTSPQFYSSLSTTCRMNISLYIVKPIPSWSVCSRRSHCTDKSACCRCQCCYMYTHNLKLPTLSWLSRDRSRTLSATDCLTRWPVAAHAHSTISWRFVTRPLYLTQLFLFLVWLSYVLISQQATIRNGHRLLLTSTCTISHPLVLVHHMTLPLRLAFKLEPSNQLETTPCHYRTSFHYNFLP